MDTVFEIMENTLKALFTILSTAQTALHSFLTDAVSKHAELTAYYVEISIILLFFMARMLYVRKKQRSVPGPKPEVIVSPVPTPAAVPDRTVHNEFIRVVFIILAILLIIAAISM